MKRQLLRIMVTSFLMTGILAVSCFADEITSLSDGQIITDTVSDAASDEVNTEISADNAAEESFAADSEDIIFDEIEEEEGYELVGDTLYVYDDAAMNAHNWTKDEGIRSQIKKAVIKSGVTTIYKSSFADCTSLKEVVIPNTVTKTSVYSSGYDSAGAFQNSTALTTVTFEEGSKLESLGDNTFYGCIALDTITLPDSVKEIGVEAFGKCTALRELKIPSNVNKINSHAFADCTSIREFTIPGSVGDKLDFDIFNGCSNLETVTYEEGVLISGPEAFNGCTKLKTVNIPASMTIISRSCFSGCAELINVNIAKDSKIEKIDEFAFCNCEKLPKFDFPGSLKEIGTSAFANCCSLEEVILPESLNKMADSVFRSATGLKKAVLSSKVSTIPRDTFSACKSLTDVTIPEKVTIIDERAFMNCESLYTVKIPSSVTDIGFQAFIYCTSLRKVEFTDNSELTGIGRDAFSGCEKLRYISFPESLRTINENAFYMCSELYSIVIPEKVTVIKYGAFSWCKNLRNITIKSNVLTLGNNVFQAAGSDFDVDPDKDGYKDKLSTYLVTECKDVKEYNWADDSRILVDAPIKEPADTNPTNPTPDKPAVPSDEINPDIIDSNTMDGDFYKVCTRISDTEYVLYLAKQQKYTIKALEATAAEKKARAYKIEIDRDSKRIAAFTNKGLVTGKKDGTATINVKKGSKTYKITVNVFTPTFGGQKLIAINDGESKCVIDTLSMKTKPTFSIPEKQQKFATVDKNTGVITAKAGVFGKVVVTATFGNPDEKGFKKITCPVAIYKQEIWCNSRTPDYLKVGKTVKLTIKKGAKQTSWMVVPGIVNPDGTIDETGAGKASFDANGKGILTGEAPGIVTVIALNNGRLMATKYVIVQ